MRKITIAVLFLLLLTISIAAAQENPDRETLVQGNNEFAFDLYHGLSTDSNLIFSPYSISTALGMTYAGARADTEQQMAEVLHFTLPQETLHPTFSELTGEMVSEDTSSEEAFTLNIVNALWGDNAFPFDQNYLTQMNDLYGAGLNLLDFKADPEAARQTINDWVAEQTADRIQDLLPQGTISPDTRLVLTNATYFKATWIEEFDPDSTSNQDFHLLDGSTVQNPMMYQEARFGYMTGENYAAVSLPYIGNQAMLVILPNEGEFETFETAFNATTYQEMIAALQYQDVQLTLPAFESEFDTSLSDALQTLGMTLAFDPDFADFSGMISPESTDRLYISDAIHKAFIKVGEEGTEAAAATAIVMDLAMAAAPPENPIVFRADRPFIYVIYDQATSSILFMGKLMNPAE